LSETLVVDCSVAAKWMFDETDRVQALRLLLAEKTGEVALISPDLLLAEFASLLAKRTRRKQISALEAQNAFHLLEESAPVLFETRPLLGTALELALRNHLSLWDCVYLALALEHDCSVITADRRLFRSGKGRHPAIRLLE
jgi:predicted nucleic acid-binding protein